MLHTLHHLFAFMIGTALGSFLTLAVLRLPEDRSVIWPGSHCPACRTPLTWRDNLPLLSWLELGGRCRTCETPIHVRYPLTELTMGLVAWLLYGRFVPPGHELDLASVAPFVVYLGFAWLVLLAGYTDLRTHIIPNESSVWGIPLGIAGTFALSWSGTVDVLVPDWRLAAIGAGIVYGLFALLSTGWRLLFGQEGFARGDVKLVAMIAAFLGPLPGAWWVILLACLIAVPSGIVSTVLARRRIYLPFGPWLALASLIYVLYTDQLLRIWGAPLAKMARLWLG